MSDPNRPWEPPSENPYGQQPQQPSSYPAYGQQPYGQQPYQQPYGEQPAYGAPAPYQPVRDLDRRPGTVLAAGITTIVLSGLSFLLLGVFTLMAVVARDDMVEAFEDELSTDDLDTFAAGDIATVLTVFLVAFAVWALVAVLLAFLAIRRSNVARILLVVSSAMTALVSLLLITSGISALWLIASVTVIVLLFTGGANEWYSRRKQQPALPPGTQHWG
jgi:hypothetical protein